jgi:hypothetical protein
MFSVFNGVRHGGLLSPFLFRAYIRVLLQRVSSSHIGCYVNGMRTNILAYADDIVLIAPSWRAMQELLNLFDLCSCDIHMSVNTMKTVCMVLNPFRRAMRFAVDFPLFTMHSNQLSFVSEFKYLGHIIDESMSDVLDIHKELKLLFTRTNVLRSRFARCSIAVKLRLFQSYCLCFYDIALWSDYAARHLVGFVSAYNRCVKIFFGYHKYYSATGMFLELRLPTFATVLHNSAHRLGLRLQGCNNALVLSVCNTN